MSSELADRRGHLIIVSAPSGAGKTTLIHRAMARLKDLRFSVSATTRPIRQGEVDGVDYDFLTYDQFQQGLKNNEFLEYEEVHGNLYGTRIGRVEPLLAAGQDVVFDLDVLGALRLKELFPDSLLIYIDVSSKELLRERLLARGREDSGEIERRLERYVLERSRADLFDRVIVNDDLERATAELIEIIEKFRRDR